MTFLKFSHSFICSVEEKFFHELLHDVLCEEESRKSTILIVELKNCHVLWMTLNIKFYKGTKVKLNPGKMSLLI